MPQERLYIRVMIGISLIASGIFFAIVLIANNISSSTDVLVTPVEVNNPLPALDLRTLEGLSASIDQYKGKVVLINLWATWCEPCRKEMPVLQEFYEKHQNDDFVLIAIDQLEKPEVITPFIKKFNLTFPVWLDLGGQAQQELQTNGLPSSYVIDRNGRIRLMWVGGISKQNLEKYVPSLIAD